MLVPEVRRGVDADLERAKRAFAATGGVQDATRVLTALLRAQGARAACAWVRAQVGDQAWLLREEAARLGRARRATLGLGIGPDRPGVARLIGAIGLLDRVVRGDWPAGADATDVAAALEAWRRLLPVVLTERLVTGVLALKGTAGKGGRPRLLGVRSEFQGALGRALRRVAADLDFDAT